MTRLWLALFAVVALLSGVTASGADFTASSPSPGNSFAAAADFNTVAVALTDPGSPLSGTVSLAATASSGRGMDRVRFQSSPAGAGAWSDVCQDTAPPYTCDFDTAGVADGSRDLRAVAVDQAGYQRTSTVAARMVDNTAPSVSIPDPGVLRGTVSVALNASDGAGSGVTSVNVEFRVGGGAWQAACADSSAPYSCDGLDTTQVPDGLYEARATAVDGIGLSSTSAPLTVRVDNGAPSATLADPGTPLQGPVALTGTASDAGSGVVSWTVQHRPAGGGAWTDACSDTAAPFTTCTWVTTGVGDGLYDVRAVARDAGGNETATTPIANRRVDNTAPAGADVQTGNASGDTAGRFGGGDWIRLTWSEPVAPASVLGGWTGTSQAITVRVANDTSNDRMDFYNAANTTRLNLVAGATDLQLNRNFVSGAKAFSATMVQSGNSITITFGAVSSSNLNTVTAAGISWRPSGGAADLAGNASSTTTVNESGGSDVDF